jgi:predicted DNA-binding transcriptional regulator YafY
VVETSARLLQLLSLLQARPEWPGAELAGRLEITPRTLRRDIQRLRDLGYPVQASRGVAGGYRLGAGPALPPLLLDDDEAIAVVVSLRTAASHTITGIEENSLRALAKLEQVLPARLRERTAALQQATVPLAGPRPMIDPAALTTIAAACRRNVRLAFGYRDHHGADSSRVTEPHRLVHAGHRWYLVARDVEHEDWRTFRADRISDPRPTGVRFVPRDPPDAASFVASSVSAAPYRFRARVIVHAPASAVAEQVTPTSGVIEPVSDDSCLLTTGAASVEAIAFHLGTLGLEFTVLEPSELIEHIRALAGRLQRSLSKQTQPGQPSRPLHP